MQLQGEPYEFIDLLRTGERKGFDILYAHFARKLYGFIYKRIRDKEAAEEIIQEVFISLWAKHETVIITTSLEAYLFGAVRLRMMSYFRAEGRRKKYEENFALFEAERFDNSSEEALNVQDIEQTIEKSLASLPEKTRTIYRMSRQQHIPNQRIAEKMNVSLKTVENNLAIALKHLRVSLGEFMVLVVLASI